MARTEAYLRAKFHLDPSNRLATVHERHRTDRTTDRYYRANRFRNGRPTSSLQRYTRYRTAYFFTVNTVDEIQKRATKLVINLNKNSSGDEIANVDFYAVRPSYRNSLKTQNNGHYAVQGHSRSPILVPIESSCTISY